LANSADLASVLPDDGLGCLDRQFGGEYVELSARVSQFALRLSSCGIRATYVLDGAPADLKLGTHLSRRAAILAECRFAARTNASSSLPAGVTSRKSVRSRMQRVSRKAPKPLFLVEAAAAALARAGADIVVAASEGDRAVAHVARKHQSRCIISNDSDFLIYDSAALVPLDSLHFDSGLVAAAGSKPDIGGLVAPSLPEHVCKTDQLGSHSEARRMAATSASDTPSPVDAVASSDGYLSPQSKPGQGSSQEGLEVLCGLALERGKLLRVLRIPGEALGALALLTGCDYSPMATVDLAWMHGAMHSAMQDHARWQPKLVLHISASSSSSSSSLSPASAHTSRAANGSDGTKASAADSGIVSLRVGSAPDKFQGRICNAK